MEKTIEQSWFDSETMEAAKEKVKNEFKLTNENINIFSYQFNHFLQRTDNMLITNYVNQKSKEENEFYLK